jgi:deoxyribonuclease V
MKINNLHSWNVSPRRAKKIQLFLKEKLILEDSFKEIKIVAGCDVAFNKKENEAYASICLFNFPSLEFIQSFFSTSKIGFPYIPGLLSFREAPLLIKLLKKINKKIDLLLFDGQGIAHPLNMGLASHMGLILDLPTIGCAKSRLYGSFKRLPTNRRGAATNLYDDNGRIIGRVLRTKKDTKPIFISSGHKISLDISQKIVLRCCRGFRLPEPIRCAHILGRKGIEKNSGN